MDNLFFQQIKEEDAYQPQIYTQFNFINQQYVKPNDPQYQHLRYLTRELIIRSQEKCQIQTKLIAQKQYFNLIFKQNHNFPMNMIQDSYFAFNPILHQSFTKNQNSKSQFLNCLKQKSAFFSTLITNKQLNQQAINNRISQLSVQFFGNFTPSVILQAENQRRKRNQKTLISSNQIIQSLNQDQIYTVLIDYFNQQFPQQLPTNNFQKIMMQMSSFYMLILQKLKIDESTLQQNNNIEEAIFNKVHSRAFTETIKQPQSLKNVTLKPYQLECLNFLTSMYNSNVLHSVPCIGKLVSGVSLSDDMGLGKTLQSIAFLLHLHEKRITQNPHLIIAPLAVTENWEKEFKRFSTNFNVAIYKGNEREKVKQDILNRNGYYNCIVTSYDYIIQDKAFFKKFTFDCVIVDEASRIKNGKSKLIGVLRNEIVCRFRILLSGTPLQNNIRELFTLLQFIHGSVFDDFAKFEQIFGKIFARNIQEIDELDEEQSNDEVNDDQTTEITSVVSTNLPTSDFLSDSEKMFIIYRLQGIIKPYMIRRIKADVLDQLPPKDEVVLRVPLSGLQNYLYNLSITEAKRIFSSDFYTSSLASSAALPKSFIRNVDMYLRKICNHPYLGLEGVQMEILYNFLLSEAQKFEIHHRQQNTAFYQKSNKVSQIDTFSVQKPQYSPLQKIFLGDALSRYSGKLSLLSSLLAKFQATDHRILIFSQFKQILSILADFLIFKDIKYLRFDGDVKDVERNKMVTEFNSENSQIMVFLLSTRAASHGLNLQSADTVIIFDSDFNAFYDLQAQDRVYRIGQMKSVKVIKLYTDSQLEQKILDIANSKLQMAQSILDAGELSQSKTLSKKELLLEIMGQNQKVKVQILTSEQVNQRISRSDQEVRVFNEIDQVLLTEFKEKYGHENLIENEVPTVFMGSEQELIKIIDKNEQPDEFKIEPQQKMYQQKIEVKKPMPQDNIHKFINIYLNVRELDFQDDIIDYITLLNLNQSQPLYENNSLLEFAQYYPLDNNLSDQVNFLRVFSGLDYQSSVITKFYNDIAFQITKLQKNSQFELQSFKICTDNEIIHVYYNNKLIENEENEIISVNNLPTPQLVSFNLKILAILHQLFHQTFSEIYIPKSQIKYRNSYPFWQLPGSKQFPQYYKIISKPISFKLIHFKAMTLQYRSLYEIITDLRLLFKNCSTFNPKNSEIVNDSRKFLDVSQIIFQKYFNGGMLQVVNEFCNQNERSGSVSKIGYKINDDMVGFGLDEKIIFQQYKIVDNNTICSNQFGSGIFGGTWFEQLANELSNGIKK